MKFTSLAAAAVVAVGISASAHAATYTQTGTVATAPTDFTTAFTVTGGATSTSFAAFQPVLGTLTSVTATFTVTGTDTGTLKNNGAATSNFQVTPSSTIGIMDASTTTPAALIASFGAGLTLSGTYSYSLTSGASATLPPSGTNAFTNSPATSTATYTGAQAAQFSANNFTVDLDTLTGINILGGGGNIAATQTTTAGGTLVLTYNYTPAVVTVPEPSTLAVLGAGLVGLGFIRRRKAA